jgi:hypothetical protein
LRRFNCSFFSPKATSEQVQKIASLQCHIVGTTSELKMTDIPEHRWNETATVTASPAFLRARYGCWWWMRLGKGADGSAYLIALSGVSGYDLKAYARRNSD